MLGLRMRLFKTIAGSHLLRGLTAYYLNLRVFQKNTTNYLNQQRISFTIRVTNTEENCNLFNVCRPKSSISHNKTVYKLKSITE